MVKFFLSEKLNITFSMTPSKPIINLSFQIIGCHNYLFPFSKQMIWFKNILHFVGPNDGNCMVFPIIFSNYFKLSLISILKFWIHPRLFIFCNLNLGLEKLCLNFPIIMLNLISLFLFNMSLSILSLCWPLVIVRLVHASFMFCTLFLLPFNIAFKSSCSSSMLSRGILKKSMFSKQDLKEFNSFLVTLSIPGFLYSTVASSVPIPSIVVSDLFLFNPRISFSFRSQVTAHQFLPLLLYGGCRSS